MDYRDAVNATAPEYRHFVMDIPRRIKEGNGFRTVHNGYVTVDGRVKMFVDEHRMAGAKFTIHPAHFFDVSDMPHLSVTIDSEIYGSVTASSRIFVGGDRVDATNPTENAETSACGRALGFMGYGIFGGIASAEEVMNAQENGAQLEPTQAEPEPKREQKKPDRPAYDDDFKRRRFWASVNNAKKKTNKSNEELKTYILDKFEVTSTNDLTEEQRREALAWMWQPKESTPTPDEAETTHQKVRELIESHNVNGEAPTQKWVMDLIQGNCDVDVPADATDPLSHVEAPEDLDKLLVAMIQLTGKKVAT